MLSFGTRLFFGPRTSVKNRKRCPSYQYWELEIDDQLPWIRR